MRRLLLFALPALATACVADDALDTEPELGATEQAAIQLYKRHPTAKGYMPGDYDGDHRADIVFKRENGFWAFDYASNGFGSIDFSAGGRGGQLQLPAPADYNGRGAFDIAIQGDDGGFVVEYAEDRQATPTSWPAWGFWSAEGEVLGGSTRLTGTPVPANYDGDAQNRADRALVSETGVWRIDYAGTGPEWDVVLFENHPGLVDAYPVPGDYWNPDPTMRGKADVAMKDLQGNWKVDYAENGFNGWEANFDSRGGSWSIPVPGHYDNDGILDLAVKADDGYWLIDYSNNGYGPWDLQIPGHGNGTVTPVPADYDGDGKTDISIVEPCGTWYIDYSANGYGPWDAYVPTTNATVAQNHRTITNASDLHALLNTAFLGTIDIPAGLTLDFTSIAANNRLPADDPKHMSLPMILSSCVRVTGVANPLAVRPILKSDDDQPTGPNPPGIDFAPGYTLFEIHGDGAHVEWLNLRGPEAGRRADNLPFFTGVGIRVYPGRADTDMVVENSELSEWPGAGVAIGGQCGAADSADWGPAMDSSGASGVRVARNWIHRNAQNGRGLGVLVDQGATALIEHNVFDRNRHAISTPGNWHTGYIALENYVLEGGYTEHAWWGDYWNQHFDIHGTGDGGYGGIGGEYFEIARNTFRGEQSYGAGSTRPALMVRGTPTIGAWFFQNVAAHDDCGQAISMKGGVTSASVHCEPDNKFNVDNSTKLGVGDFDGDGLDDVFLGTGVTWWYSPAGSTEWKYLNTAQETASQLKFARVDADWKTDVIADLGGWLYYSSAGTGPWQFLAGTFPDSPLSKMHFADFTGDGKADIFRTTGTQWWLWESHTGLWRPTQYATLAFEDMRFGDFDDWAGVDVLAKVGTKWYLASGSTVAWQVHYTPISTTPLLRNTVVADFNGDGRSDIGWRQSNTWQYLATGKGTQRWLRTIGPMATCETSGVGSLPTPPACPSYAEIKSPDVLLGRFDPWNGADAVVMEKYRYWNGSYWTEPYEHHFAWWNGWSNGFARLTPTEMR